MMPIPDLTGADIAFGNIKHLPKREDLPEEFQSETSPFCDAVSFWFYSGAKALPNGLEINGQKYVAKSGVDARKVLMAIQAALCSFEPSHEHKIGGCGFLLSEWFEVEK